MKVTRPRSKRALGSEFDSQETIRYSLAGSRHAYDLQPTLPSFALRISPSTVDQHDSGYRLSAAVEFDANQLELPENLWFSIRGSEAHLFPSVLDAFLIGLLPMAMKLGEDIKVEGKISSHLAYGLTHYQSILNSWWPQLFRPVNIEYSEIYIQHEARAEGAVCTFSGGVDSFYSVLNHLPAQMKNPSYQLTHAMMINGFDQLNDYEGDGSSQTMLDIYYPVLKSFGVELLMIDTNLKTFRDKIFKRVELPLTQANPLSSCAHLLSSFCSRFLLAGHAAYQHTKMLPSGSHPVLDHHLGSDTLQIIHADANVTRAEKIEFISNFPEVQKHLRVCFGSLKFRETENGTAATNCCQCEKCLRTYTVVDILGKSSQFTSFRDSHNFTEKTCLNLMVTSKPEFLMENLSLAKQHGRHDWEKRISRALQYQYQYIQKMNQQSAARRKP